MLDAFACCLQLVLECARRIWKERCPGHRRVSRNFDALPFSFQGKV